MKIEMANEVDRREVSVELSVEELSTLSEQMEMDAAMANAEQANEHANEEQAEMDKGAEKLGYSSDHYEWELEQALEKGNSVAYDNAKRNWAKAKAREETH